MKVLVYGLGSIAKKHVAQLQKIFSDKLEVYALRHGKKGSHAGEDVISIYDESELETEPDFILISNPTSLRTETLKRAIRWNKPLFIEKPSLFSLADAGEIERLIEEKNMLTYVACNLRFHPCLLFLKEKLQGEASKVEEVNIYCGSYLPEWRSSGNFRLDYSANADMGGGVHLDLIHELDYCYWLFGAPQKVTSCKKASSHLQITAFDYATYLLEYNEFVADVTLNYFRRNKKRALEIVTPEGTWLADLIGNKVYFNDAEVASFPAFQMADTYHDQLVYFLDSVRENTQPMNSFRESVEVLRIALS